MKKVYSSFILHPSSFFFHPSREAFILFFTLFALAPLTAPGYFTFAHDARHSVYFLQMFDASFRDGAWFPRWAADMVFGYGYPLWIILAPIPFFAGEIFHLIGFDIPTSIKIVDGLALFLSALAMYLFASRVLDKNAALVAAVAYTYIPFHLVDIYVRASQAELVSYIFPPLVLWAFHQLATTCNAKYISLAALSYAGLLLSHISMAVIWTPVIGAYLVFLLFVIASPKGAKQSPTNTEIASSHKSLLAMTHNPYVLRFTFYTFLSILLALCLAAVFLLPVLFEQKYLTSDPLVGGFFNYRKHFLNPSQLFSPTWGYGYAGENGADQFSLQLGLLPVLLAFLSMFTLRAARGVARANIAFFALVTAAIVFLVLPYSAPLWEPFASIIGFVQFPWRLLIISSFSLAFLCGAAMNAFSESETDLPVALVVCLLIVAANYAYAKPQFTDATLNFQTQMEFEVKYRELLGDTIWTINRPDSSPLVEQYERGAGLQKAVALDGNARVETIRHAGSSDDVQIDATTPARVMVMTRFFPGWTATLDSAPIVIVPEGEQGLIATRDPVPPGSHLLKVRFQDTPIRQIGTGVSLIALVIALVVWRRSC